ncbi:MAG TPA: type II secretion system F family protein [Actinomycetales bacterium]|nr:type II secretion system F family protein [Actinomycetales bacterium]
MTALLVALLVLGAVLALGGGPRRRLRRVLAPAASAPVATGAPEGTPADVALLADLVAAALAAGVPPVTALDEAGRAVGGAEADDLVRVASRLRLGSDADGAWAGTSPELDPVRRCLGIAHHTGAPAARLLRDVATELRRRRRRGAERRASRLGVALVLPLGLCALPAFGALAVVPVVLSLAGQVLAGAP